jgi:hypothetical protein
MKNLTKILTIITVAAIFTACKIEVDSPDGKVKIDTEKLEITDDTINLQEGAVEIESAAGERVEVNSGKIKITEDSIEIDNIK